jgi:hypothetical protein
MVTMQGGRRRGETIVPAFRWMVYEVWSIKIGAVTTVEHPAIFEVVDA